jgi:hypothetical protein
MPASRFPTPSSSSVGSSPLDNFDDLISSIVNTPLAADAAPPPVATSGLTLVAAAPAAPQSSTSAATASSSGGALRGFINGKVGLYFYDGPVANVICAGYLGGSNGSRMRFCCRPVAGGVGLKNMFCSPAHQPEKCALTAKTTTFP